MPHKLTIRMRKNSELSSQAIGDEVIVLDKQQNQLHQLNRVASYIWQRLDAPFSSDDIVRALVTDFDIDESTAQQDVQHMIKEFLHCGLLVN